MAEHISELGGTLSSEQKFSLDIPKTLARVIEGELPAEGLWAVRLVQGAYAAGAKEVSFTFGKISIEFSMHGGKTLSAAELFRKATSNGACDNDSERHFVSAVRSLYRLAPRVVQWTCQTEQGVDCVEAVSDRITHRLEKPSSNDVSFRMVVKFQLRRLLLLKRMTADYKAVCDRCRLSQLPVIVDSRLVSRREPPLPVLRPVSAVWVTEERNDPQVRHFPLHLSEVNEAANKDGIYINPDESWITRRSMSQAGLYNCPLIVCLTKSKELAGSGTVHWLVDGALVETTELPVLVQKWQLDLVCPASLSDLEASGWSPRDPDKLLPAALISETLKSLHDTLAPYPQALESAVLSPTPEGPLAKMDKVLFSCMFTLAAEGWRAGTQANWSGAELLDSLKRIADGLLQVRS